MVRFWIGLASILIVGQWSAGGMLYQLSIQQCPELLKLNDLQKKGLFTDVVIESNDGTQFEAHRAVLAAKSDKLRKMILDAEIGKACTCEKTIIKLPVDSKLLNESLEFAYTGEISVDNDTVNPLLLVANQLGLTELLETIVENFVDSSTETTLVTMITTTTAQPRSPELIDKLVEQVTNIEEVDEEQTVQVVKKFDPELMKAYLDKTKLKPTKLVKPITEWLKELPDTPGTTNQAVAEVLEKLPYEEFNCTELKKIADELTKSDDPKHAEAAKVVLKKIMELSSEAKGECYETCADCERLYQFNTTLDYKAGSPWSSTLLTPHRITGLETSLGKFKPNGAQFNVMLQRADKTQAPNIGLGGLLLQYVPPLVGKTSKLEKAKEYDIEIQISEPGKEKDCPLRNRFRYKFDSNSKDYKWLTKIDTTKDQTVHIKMNEVM